VIRLAVRVRREQAELVLSELLELTPAGVEEVAVGEDVVEYAVYGTPGELPALPDVSALAGGALVEISTSDVADDWQERWKDFHRPVLIVAPKSIDGRRSLPALHVRPPWEAPCASGDGAVREIVIDPGQAFGTGAHATTRMCLELLLELAAQTPRERVGALLDVGTGSGVLAIAGAGLGFAPVLALDNERESVAAASENAAVNDVEIEVRRFDLRTQELPWFGAAGDRPRGELVVTANLLRPLLLELASAAPCAPAQLIAGGLLREEVDEIAAAFAALHAMRERERRESGEWAAVWLTGPAPDS
jgi:ribosomal protein L11 methyltransferase